MESSIASPSLASQVASEPGENKPSSPYSLRIHCRNESRARVPVSAETVRLRQALGAIITGTHSLLHKVPAAVDRAAQNKKEERLWLFGSSPSGRSTRNWLHVDISESLEMRKDVNRGSCQSYSRDSRAPHPASPPESRLPPTSRWRAKP